MKRKEVRSIDLDTGEILDGVLVYCGVKVNPYGGGWIMNSQKALEELAIDDDLTGKTYKVLLVIMGRLDFENWIQISQTEIAEKLKMKLPHVSRAISLLIKKRIILRGPKLGRSYAFRLNPDFGWKGKVKNLNDYRREEQDRRRKEFKKRHLKAVDTPPKSDESE
jgi:hypothetical protein